MGGDDGDDAALPGEGKRLLVPRGVVLADRGEGLVLVTDEDGGPEVTLRVRFHLCRPPEQGLEPGVFEEHADGAGQRRIRARGHVERQDLSALDQLVQGGRCHRILALSVGGRPSAFSSSLPPSSPGSRGFRAPPSSSFTSGAFGQKMAATSAMSNRDRKLEMPSTHEVLNFGSSFIQSFSYHVLTLSSRAPNSSVSVWAFTARLL